MSLFSSGLNRLLIVTLFACLAFGQVRAATPETADAAELERLVEQARQGGGTVMVIEMPGATATEPALGSALRENALRARARFGEILAGTGLFLGHAGEAIRRHDPGGSLAWPIAAVLLAVLYLAIGYGAEWLYHIWARPRFRHLFNPTPQSKAEKIAYLLLRSGLQLVGVTLQIGVALALGVAADRGLKHVQDTQLTVIGAVAAWRMLAIFFENLLAQGMASHRLLNLSDAAAATLYRGLLALLTVVAAMVSLCLWMEALALDRDAHLLSLIGATLVSAALIVGFAFWQRQVVAGMMLGAGPPEAKPLALRLLAGGWHVLALLYFAIAWSVTAVRLVLDQPNALGLVTLPVLILFLAIAVYGAALLLVECLFGRRAAMPSAPDAADAVAPDRPKSFKDLTRRAAALIVVAATVWLICDLWGVDLAKPGSLLHSLWEILLVAFLAYLALESVKIAIDRRIEEEGGFEAPEPGEEGGGAASASRLATLLPLFRNFLLIVIAVIAGMIALSELGVDIAPLFAGAGVVGLAIGFGAQTLIRDIFSGAFFLMDDAFRRGEYIDIGGVKGTVEKISVRSMQLRHHMGPLHTIPFGEIQHLTNYSRDWVMMKLPLRVTYDTDVEKVRKLIKTLGTELQADPVIGDKFLQPLKSQGVYKMEDSAMILRVKFMTRPGEQFVVRKQVYAAIRVLFEQEGIKFAHREVTVRVAETPQGRTLTEAQKQAVTGAVREVIEGGETKATGTGER